MPDAPLYNRIGEALEPLGFVGDGKRWNLKVAGRQIYVKPDTDYGSEQAVIAFRRIDVEMGRNVVQTDALISEHNAELKAKLLETVQALRAASIPVDYMATYARREIYQHELGKLGMRREYEGWKSLDTDDPIAAALAETGLDWEEFGRGVWQTNVGGNRIVVVESHSDDKAMIGFAIVDEDETGGLTFRERGRRLKPGTVDLFRVLRSVTQALGRNGVKVGYVAETASGTGNNSRADVYARIMEGEGWNNTGEETYGTDRRVTWSPPIGLGKTAEDPGLSADYAELERQLEEGEWKSVFDDDRDENTGEMQSDYAEHHLSIDKGMLDEVLAKNEYATLRLEYVGDDDEWRWVIDGITMWPSNYSSWNTDRQRVVEAGLRVFNGACKDEVSRILDMHEVPVDLQAQPLIAADWIEENSEFNRGRGLPRVAQRDARFIRQVYGEGKYKSMRQVRKTAGAFPYFVSPDDFVEVEMTCTAELRAWREAVKEHEMLENLTQRMKHRNELEEAFDALRTCYRGMKSGGESEGA